MKPLSNTKISSMRWFSNLCSCLDIISLSLLYFAQPLHHLKKIPSSVIKFLIYEHCGVKHQSTGISHSLLGIASIINTASIFMVCVLYLRSEPKKSHRNDSGKKSSRKKAEEKHKVLDFFFEKYLYI